MASKPFSSDGKASACNVGDLGSIPGSGKSLGEGNGNPHQYSFLENPMDGGAWWATVHGVAKSRTRLSDFTHSLTHLMPYFTLTIVFWSSSSNLWLLEKVFLVPLLLWAMCNHSQEFSFGLPWLTVGFTTELKYFSLYQFIKWEWLEFHFYFCIL